MPMMVIIGIAIPPVFIGCGGCYSEIGRASGGCIVVKLFIIDLFAAEDGW
ncbi:hypothetical protein [Corynebacterium kutscheri]|nr:hypothetical protein [Corynebacterium kutscheri]